VNVYWYQYGILVYPLRISDCIKRPKSHVNLVLISEGETQHYCWISLNGNSIPMGIGKFQPLQNQYPWTNRQKIRHSWLCPRGDPVHQIWYKSTHWGLLGKWVKYNKNYFLFIPFFLRHAHRSDQWMDFTRDSSKDVKSRKDMPFGGLNDVPLNFGVKLPQKIKFWGHE